MLYQQLLNIIFWGKHIKVFFIFLIMSGSYYNNSYVMYGKSLISTEIVVICIKECLHLSIKEFVIIVYLEKDSNFIL